MRPISSRIRFRVLQRDAFTCRYCGRRAPDVALQVDHVKARSRGGDDGFENLVTSCVDCNLGKGTTALWPDQETLDAIWLKYVELTDNCPGVREVDAEGEPIYVNLFVFGHQQLRDYLLAGLTLQRVMELLDQMAERIAQVRLSALAAWLYFDDLCHAEFERLGG